ncbi:MAG TPA: hypothetical protein VF618_14405 [Thermoanaerobaculia bacterium]
MQPHGSDTVRLVPPEVILTSATDKGWRARVSRYPREEFPGTPVDWDGEFFEVTSVIPLADGTIEYVLEPWRDENVLRGLQRYDAASEAQRIAEAEAARARARNSRWVSWLAMLTGHLPGNVQNRLASDLGVIPTRLTYLSLIPPVLFFVVVGQSVVGAIVAKRAVTLPFLVILAAMYLLVESGVRFYIAWTLERPIGSAAGFLGYILYYWGARDRSRLVPPVTRDGPLVRTPPPDDVALQDMLKMRKAFFTLLTPAEQKTLARRWGYVYRDDANVVAFILLLFAGAGAVTSWLKLADGGFSVTALLSLLTAGLVAIEQLLRLHTLQRGPAGSVLAPLVRPLARKFLQ